MVGRRARWRLLALLGAVGLTVSLGAAGPAKAAADDCPNAQFRSGSQSQLPDCRAYELVSPVEGNTDAIGPAQGPNVLAAAGDALFYQALSPFPGVPAGGGGLGTEYISRRTGSGWVSRNVNPPQVNVAGDPKPSVYLSLSADLSRALLRAYDPPLVPGAPSGHLMRNWYMVGSPGQEGTAYASVASGKDGFFQLFPQGADAGFDKLLVGVTNNNPTPVPPLTGLHELVGGSFREAGLLPDGTPAPTARLGADATCQQRTQHAVSDDGERVVFTVPLVDTYCVNGGSFSGDIYIREGGTVTVPVSESRRDPVDPNGHQSALFWDATADGSRVYFTSSEKLTDEAQTGPESTGTDLYEYNAETGDLTDITVDDDPADPLGAEVQGVLGAGSGANGVYVYFAAKGALAPGAVSGQPNLYAWHDDGAQRSVRFVATLSGEGSEELCFSELAVVDSCNWSRFVSRISSRVTPDGRHLAFTSVKSLTGFDNTNPESGEPQPEAYVYDAASAEIACASCPADGARPTGLSSITTPTSLGGEYSSWSLPRNLSDDGRRLFFESASPLVPGDSDGTQDVYMYDVGVGRPVLISDGEAPAPSSFVNASSSGDDAFIVTRDRLVAADGDTDKDIYDVRVGGGFPVAAVPPPCLGDECQGPARALPAAAPAATAGFSGPASPPRRQAKKSRRCGSGKVRRKGRCVKRPRQAKQRHNHKRGAGK
jgi:hypothetical protein